jgi:2-alkyl-3-oxoalkanoate reductase
VLVAGGTGAVGRHLIPALVADGHQVTASTRSAGKSADLAAAGAVPVVMDGLDRDAVLALDIADGAVQPVRCVVNPEKLRHLESERPHV